jgi:hypothetical protein
LRAISISHRRRLVLAELAEATGGVVLDTLGQAEIRNVLTSDQVRATREKIALKFPTPSSTLTPLQRFLRWSVSDRRSRTISPFSELTTEEWVENRITEGTLNSLQAAIQVDPADTLSGYLLSLCVLICRISGVKFCTVFGVPAPELERRCQMSIPRPFHAFLPKPASRLLAHSLKILAAHHAKQSAA